MRRHLQIIAISFALLLFGWSGVLAAALCAHARGAHAAALLAGDSCCATHAAQEAAAENAAAPAEEAEEEAGHCALMSAADAAHHAPASEQHRQLSAQAGASAAQETIDCAQGAGEEQASAPAPVESFAPASCAYCLGRPETPTAPAVTARIPDRTAKGADGPAPRAETSPALTPRRFIPSINPTQGAPPGQARRHVLLNIFLI